MMKLLVSVLMLSTLVIVNAAGQPTIAPTISSTTFAAVSLQLSSPWPKQGRNQYNLGQSLFAGVRDNSTNWELALISAIPNSPPVIDKNGTVYFGCQHGLFVAVNSDGTLRWTFDANISGGGSISSAALIASDDTVYFGSGPFLFGLNHLGEKVYQSAALGGDIGSGSGPVMGLSGSLYVCATDGFMYAFAPPVTTEKWQFALNNTYSSPLIASGGDIVVGSSDGFLYKLKDNGNSAFQVFKTSMDPSRMTPLTSPVYIESIDQYAVASREGHLYVVSAINGAVFNTYFITTSAADASVSVGSNSALYLGNLGGSVRAINMSTGVILWTKTIGSPVVSTAVISSDELIYVFTDDGVLHCLDGQNAGNQLWAFHTKTPAPYTISPAIGSDGVVYVAVGDGAVRSIGSPAPQCNVAPSYYSSLDVITCVEPTGQPTGQPTRQPSSSLPTFTTTPVPTAVPSTAAPTAPTSVPTSHPSYVPSYVPSGQPTSVPSQAPSTALQSEVTLTAVTRLTSISAAQFENGTANTAAFKETVASVIGNHVSSSDVIIVNVTDTSTVRRVRGRVLATSSCDIGWTVTYVSQVVNPAATTDSTASTVESLVNTATNDGSFDAMLVSLAPSLTGVSAGLPVFSPTIFVAIVKSAFPTSQPSGQPSGPPTGQPSGQPSIQPSSQPSSYPSREPSSAPSVVPTGQPSGQPTGVPTGQPTGQPTAQPTSSPSCNAGSYDVVNIDGVVGTRGCEICPAGTYSGAGGSVKCTKCPLDTYSDSVGSDHCTQCPWPSSTDSVGKTECYGYRLTSQFSIVATVLSAVLAIYIFCWLSSGGESIAVTVNMIMPMLDHLTDINYVMFERFHRPFMFGLAVLFLFAPCMVFTYELYEKGYRPYFLIPFTVLWLETNSDGNPKHVDFDLNIGGVSLTPSAQDSLTKLLWYWIFWGICIAVQAATLVFLLVWVVMYSCFIILWWFLGTLLYQSRNLAVGKISLMWYSTWNPVVFEELGVKAEKVDRGLMNRALFSGFVLETVPQLMLQVVNNTSKDSGAWSVTSIASTTMSVYMCISGLYRFAYYHWYRGYSFDDILIATIAIPGVDKKYTSLNGRSGDSEARHVRAADRMIRTVSKYVPKSESATNKTHQRRSTFSDGTTAYRELLSEGVYTTDAAGTVHRVPTTLHSVLTAQVGLLNDEYSYDHARIKQAKDTIVVTTIGDGRKNRMIALQNYFKIETPVDICVLDADTRSELALYLTVEACRNFMAYHTYIAQHLYTVPALMFQIISTDSNFDRMLSDKEVLTLRSQDPEKLIRIIRLKAAPEEMSKADLNDFLTNVDNMIEGDKDPYRFRPDLWVPRPTEEIESLRSRTNSVEACAAGITYADAVELSRALVPQMSREFMLYWEISAYLGPDGLANHGALRHNDDHSGGGFRRGLSDLASTAMDDIVGGVHLVVDGISDGIAAGTKGLFASATTDAGTESGGGGISSNSATGVARLVAAVGDIEMAGISGTASAAAAAAAAADDDDDKCENGGKNSVSVANSHKIRRLRSVLHQQMQLLCDPNSYKADKLHRYTTCSISGNQFAMIRALERLGFSDADSSSITTGNRHSDVVDVNSETYSIAQMAALCVLSAENFADINHTLSRVALHSFSANQAFIFQHKYQLPWLMYELVRDPSTYLHQAGVAATMKRLLSQCAGVDIGVGAGTGISSDHSTNAADDNADVHYNDNDINNTCDDAAANVNGGGIDAASAEIFIDGSVTDVQIEAMCNCLQAPFASDLELYWAVLKRLYPRSGKRE